MIPDYLAVILGGLVAIAIAAFGYLFADRLRDIAGAMRAAMRPRPARQDGTAYYPRHPDAAQQNPLQQSPVQPNSTPLTQEKPMASKPHGHEELPVESADPVLRVLHWVMRVAAYVLAIAMVAVIVEGVISVIYELYLAFVTKPYFLMPDIVPIFGAFLAVLIAFEIFANITLYIRADVFPVKLVIATALMAISRKIIVVDMSEYSALDLVGVAAVVIALGATYWMVSLVDQGQGIRVGSRHDC